MSNFLVNVERFMMDPALALLQNQMAVASLANPRFSKFNNEPGQLGQSIKIQQRYRSVSQKGSLSATTVGDVTQRFITLTVNQKAYVRYDIQNLEAIFNDLEMNGNQVESLTESACADLATQVENNLSQEFINSTYRSYALTSNSTVTDLIKAVTDLNCYGGTPDKTEMVFPLAMQPKFIGNGQGQFVPQRNDEQYLSWQLGSVGNTNFYTSNLLQTQQAGVAGISGHPLKIKSISVDRTQVTFFAPASTPDTLNYLKAGDVLAFAALSHGGVNLVSPSYTGYINQQNLPVQCNIQSNADLVGGEVTVTVYPALVATVGSQDQSLSREFNFAEAVGDDSDYAKSSGNHVAGCLFHGNAFYVAFPVLPELDPYKTVIKTDPKTGVSFRFRYGAADYAEAVKSMTIDLIYDKVMSPQYASRLIIPSSVMAPSTATYVGN